MQTHRRCIFGQGAASDEEKNLTPNEEHYIEDIIED